MKLYHGTSKEGIERILDEGFKMFPSREMFLGFGVYLTPSKEKARKYGSEVVEVDLPDDVKVCHEPLAGIGIFEDWKEDETKWREDVGMRVPNEKQLFKDYIRFAKDERDINLKDGCPVLTDGSQYVVFDEKVIRRLRPRRVHG